MAEQFREEAFKIYRIPRKIPLFEVFRAGAHSYPQFMENADLLNKEFKEIKVNRTKSVKDHSQYNFSIEIDKGTACINLRVQLPLDYRVPSVQGDLQREQPPYDLGLRTHYFRKFR